MSFNVKGFARYAIGGAVGTGKGSVKSKCMYVHDTDDAAAVETAGYFNSIADDLAVGDQIDCSLDLSGTPERRDYIVSSNAGGVVGITLATATAAV